MTSVYRAGLFLLVRITPPPALGLCMAHSIYLKSAMSVKATTKQARIPRTASTSAPHVLRVPCSA